MKLRHGIWIFLSLFLIVPTRRLGAQQAAPAALTPKQMQEERAKVQMAEKRYDAAIQSYLDLLKTDPKNAIYMNMIGIAYLDLSNYEQAKKYLVDALKDTNSQHIEIFDHLGETYIALGQREAALDAWRSGLKVVGDDPASQRRDPEQFRGRLVLVGLGVDADLGDDGLDVGAWAATGWPAGVVPSRLPRHDLPSRARWRASPQWNS